jgi:hypothetical protein
MKIISCLLLLVAAMSCDAQAGGDTVMYTDTFAGMVNSINTTLVLRHCRYCDMGTFILRRKGDTAIKGEWTVLRGSATDRNATVVDLYLESKEYYYLRRNKTTLQQLDDSLRVIKPAEKYILRKP